MRHFPRLVMTMLSSEAAVSRSPRAPNPDVLGDPLGIPDSDYPHEGTPEEQLYFLLHYAVLAPSVLNTQPWRFAVEHRIARLYPDRARQLHRRDPDGRELVISCGAALLNLRVAACRFGHGAEVYSFPTPDTPDLLAALLLHGRVRPSDRDKKLFCAIAQRCTNRRRFTAVELDGVQVAALEQAADEEGAYLAVFTEGGEKEAVGRLVEEGVRLQGQDPSFVDELGAWLRPEGDPRRDGIPDEVQGVWDRHARVSTPTSTAAAKKHDLVTTSPAVLVLATEADEPADWLTAGQALGRVLLTATAAKLQASFLNQPVEVPTLRGPLAELVEQRFPQVVFRVGHSVQQSRSPRRLMRDVLFQDAPPPAWSFRDV